MVQKWQTKKLGGVCEVIGGGTPSTSVSKYWNGGVVWLTPKDLGKLKEIEIFDSNKKISEEGLRKSSARLLSKGTIVLSSRAPIGYLAIAGIPLATNQGCRSFICDEKKIYNKFLYYFLQTQIEHLNNLGGGSTFKEISGSKLKEVKIPLPSLSEQKKIVAKLEKLLAKTREAKRLRAEAQEAAQNLLSAELHKIFEEGKKKGWEEKELREICELNPKKSEIKNEANELLVSFVPMKAVDEYAQAITYSDERELGLARYGYTYFRDGDIVLAKITPCMENGKIAIAKNLKNGIGFGTTEFHVIRAKERVLPEWVYYILRQPFFRDAAKERMTGSAGQKRVPVQFLEKYKIFLPPLAEQKKIVARLDALSEKIRKLQEYQKETRSDLVKLEQSILHKAFQGKSSLKWINIA